MTNRPIPDGSGYWFLKGVISDPPESCVEWPFGLSRGRPMYKLNGQGMHAGRAALVMSSGEPAADGMHAAHEPGICHNTMCVNPRHLRWATPKQNNQDKIVDGTWQGGSNNPAAKLTETIVAYMRTSELSTAELARQYGVSEAAVANARKGKTWRHVKSPITS